MDEDVEDTKELYTYLLLAGQNIGYLKNEIEQRIVDLKIGMQKYRHGKNGLLKEITRCEIRKRAYEEAYKEIEECAKVVVPKLSEDDIRIMATACAHMVQSGEYHDVFDYDKIVVRANELEFAANYHRRMLRNEDKFKEYFDLLKEDRKLWECEYANWKLYSNANNKWMYPAHRHLKSWKYYHEKRNKLADRIRELFGEITEQP